MKMTCGLALLTVLFAGCATSPQLAYYTEIAKSSTFDYFFPSPSDTRTFATLQEAQDFVSEAQIKLESSINKKTAKGLAARLKGPAVTDDQPVVVYHFLTASTASAAIDLSGAKDELQSKLEHAISVSSVYLVFFDDRAVSISSFLLDSHYYYNSNSQYGVFQFRNARYTTDYPIGWGTRQAFQYLSKVTD